MKIRVWIIATAVAITGLFTVSTLANPIDPISDYLAVYDAAGTRVDYVEVRESQEDPNQIYVIPDSSLIDVTMFGLPTNVRAKDGTFSDIFGISRAFSGELFLAFASDFPPFAPVGAIFVDQTPNGLYDATPYLNPDLRGRGYKAVFFSDEGVVTTPDGGATVLLLGAAASSLALFRLRRA